MKKKLLSLVFFTIFNFVNAQFTITNTQTPAQLVQNVLLGQGISVSNVKYNGSTVNATLPRDQVGYFENGSLTNIGLKSGIILATGKSSVAMGPNNTGSKSDVSTQAIVGDPDLALLTTNTVRNAAILEFDFVAMGQSLSFNFVFGSEEYPEFVNSSFNDVFGFFLSGPGITGPFSGNARNIALVPNTITPITINNVNGGYASGCPTTLPGGNNSQYYVNNCNGATIQYDGFTTVIAAMADIECGMTYHIKLAVANVGDNSYDSAVFLQANSFTAPTINFPSDFLSSSGNALCNGSTLTLNTGMFSTILHKWEKNGVVIANETNSTIVINQPGTYCVTAYPYGLGCPVSECVTIEFQPPMNISNPLNMVKCGTGMQTFDLTSNTPVITNGSSNFTVQYFTNQTDAQNLTNEVANPSSYLGSNGQIIYVVIKDLTTGCKIIKTFTLNFAPFISAQPVDQTVQAGNNVSFSISSLASYANYQWQSDLGSGFVNLSNSGQFNGVNTNSLFIQNASQLNNNQKFRCIINVGNCEEISTFAVLTVEGTLNNNDFTFESKNSITPIPSKDIINLEVKNSLIGTKYFIVDLLGRKVSSGIINNEKSKINISEFKPGTYILNFSDRTSSPIKFIKN